MGYPKKQYKLIGFERSHIKTKKYNAILLNKKTGRNVRVPFGGRGYEQYKDSTGLGLYSKYDHADKNRRRLYRARHKNDNLKDYGPGYFSWYYLW